MRFSSLQIRVKENADERRSFDSLTERVLRAIFEVANTLGAGFIEKVYERALLEELRVCGIKAVSQASFPVTYKGEYVGGILRRHSCRERCTGLPRRAWPRLCGDAR